MEFLYGDSTPSPLASNFLEFLRDAIDFGVFALHIDDEIATIGERGRGISLAAEQEVEQLETLGRAVAAVIDGTSKGADDSETTRCATQLAATSADAIASAIAAVREKLEGRRAEIAGEESAQREALFKALEALLLPHSPPESVVSVRIARGPTRGYVAWRHGETPFDLRWRIELGIPSGNAFGGEAPMERLAPRVEIHAPEQAGWLKKEVKLKAQRLDKLALTEAVDDGRTVTLKLRNDAAGAHGLDLEVDLEAGSASAARAGASDDPSAGTFELTAEDVSGLVGVAEQVRKAAGELTATQLVEATLEDRELRQETTFAGLVGQLVSLMAPIVQDVSRHSLTPTELVLRRQLSSERREEIFVAKATLREKFKPLRPELRAIFERLELDGVAPPPRSSARATPEENDWPKTRAELPPSDPPPALKPSRPPPPR
jgi:hypothetical protein